MTVSVIVITYENPASLIKALEGLALQLKPPDEVIVADDGSGPETTETVEHFRERTFFPLLHVRHEKSGFRSAKIRNEAIKKSTGDYIVFLDGDCVPNRHFISDHIALSEKGFFVQGKRVLVGRDASESFNAVKANSPSACLNLAISGMAENSHHMLRLPAFPSLKGTSLRGIKSCNLGIFKDDILSVNGFNEDFIGWGREDSELAVRLYSYGLKRKEHPFMAVCFHLWHKDVSRDGLPRNEELLNKTISTGGFRCSNGIVKEGA